MQTLDVYLIMANLSAEITPDAILRNVNFNLFLGRGGGILPDPPGESMLHML